MCSVQLVEWVDLVFGFAESGNYDSVLWLYEVSPSDPRNLTYLTETFENSSRLLHPYSDAVLDRAFWDLSHSAFRLVYEPGIEWELRHRFIRSFENLFRDLFASRCDPRFRGGHPEGSALNPSCYMWWDFDCWCAMPDPLTRNPYDSAFLDAMKAILALNHPSCQESALHGLGHWHWAHRSAVEAIIDDYLGDRRRQIPEDLRRYALAARCGCVQ